MKQMNCCIVKKYSRVRCTNKSTRLFNYKFYCKNHFNKRINIIKKNKKVNFNLSFNQIILI
jgi:hypothetical protein